MTDSMTRCRLNFRRGGLVAGVLMAGCLLANRTEAREKGMTYRVARAESSASFDGDWNGAYWKDIKPLQLQYFMGDKPEHFPRVEAKLVYDDRAISVIFRVDDRYVRAVAKEHQGPVWLDSCVEFFFTPGEDVGQGYFNLEMNCGGTMLFHFQKQPSQDEVRIAEGDLKQIDVRHSLPRIVEPEITEPTQWTVAYQIPVDMLKPYFPGKFERPAAGVLWRANLYKCADETSHPHWLTWSPVEFERPDFHRPQSFGTLIFQ